MTTEGIQDHENDPLWVKYKRAMVVVAHPDDAEFGLGGALAKIVKEGMELAYVLCTNGDKGTTDPDITSEELAVIRQRGAARRIGHNRLRRT